MEFKVGESEKMYEYRMRREDANKVTQNFPLNDSAPTIAAKPPPLSKELFLLKKSRFKKSNAGDSSES